MDIRTDFSLEVSQISKFQVQMLSLDEKCVRNSQMIPKCVIFDFFSNRMDGCGGHENNFARKCQRHFNGLRINIELQLPSFGIESGL